MIAFMFLLLLKQTTICYSSQIQNIYQKIVSIQVQGLLYKLIIMGGNQSKDAEILRYVESEWEPTSIKGEKTIYKNNRTDKEAESQSILVDPHHSVQRQMNIYNYRRQQQNALVETYAVQHIKKDTTFCGNQEELKVFYERIPKRFSQMQKIPFPQSIYVLSESLRGFKDCYSKVGYFDVTDRMIGINSSGFVKVWLNQNFAENHPTKERTTLQMTELPNTELSNDNEKKMVKKIVQIVQKKCVVSPFPPEFIKDISPINNFTDTYQGIQRFCVRNNLSPPDRIQPSLSYVRSFHLFQNNIRSNPPPIQTPMFRQNAESQSVINSPSLKNLPVYPPTRPINVQPMVQTSMQQQNFPIRINFQR